MGASHLRLVDLSTDILFKYIWGDGESERILD